MIELILKLLFHKIFLSQLLLSLDQCKQLVNRMNRTNNSPLHLAAIYQNIEIFQVNVSRFILHYKHNLIWNSLLNFLLKFLLQIFSV